MPIVAMTREIGSLGGSVAQAVARRLGYDYVRQEIIAEAARRYEADPAILAATVEAKARPLAPRAVSARRHFAYVTVETLNIALRDRVVILGRWSTLLLRGVGHAVRVRVCAPLEVRAGRLAERLGVSIDEATARLIRSDEGVRSRIQQFFNVAWDDPRLYDLSLNTERLSAEEAAEVVVHAVTLPAWQPTELSRAALWDAALAARIRAAFKAAPEASHLDVTIQCRAGRAELTGTVAGEAEREAVGRIAAGFAGAQAVENRLVVTRMPVH